MGLYYNPPQSSPEDVHVLEASEVGGDYKMSFRFQVEGNRSTHEAFCFVSL